MDAMNTNNMSSAIFSGVELDSQEGLIARLDRLPISWWHVKTRIIIGVATFFDAFDALAIATVLPVLVPLWKLTPPQIGFLISAGYFGQLIGAFFFGWIAGRYGRMTGMIWSIAIFALMSVACSFAWSYESLLLARIIQGIGLGGEVPIAAVYISEIARAEVRGRFVMLFELLFPIGIIAASLIGLWVVPSFGWQWMFAIGAVPAILAVFLRRALPESPRWLASKGRLAEANAAVCLIERATEKGTGAPLPPPRLVLAVKDKKASLADLFGPRYLRRTIVVWIIWFSSFLILYGLLVWMPTVYRTVFHLTLAQSLQYGLITSVISFLGAAIMTLLIDQIGRKLLFSISFVCSGAALLLASRILSPAPEQVLIYVAGSAFFMGVINLAVYLYTPELYPTRARAIGVGTATAWARLASMVGPTVVGYMIESGLQSVFLTFGLIAVAAGIVTFVFATETKKCVLENVSP